MTNHDPQQRRCFHETPSSPATKRSGNAPCFRGVILILLIGIVCPLLATPAHAAKWLERLGLGRKQPNSEAIVAALSNDEVASALKEALGKGVEHAVASLGKADGFFGDRSVKIPLPKSLERVERGLRLVRQDKIADEFVLTMNRAAERAVPEGAAVLKDSLQEMTLADAKTILTSTNNAATEFFRRTSHTNLYTRFYPIVQKATEETGLTRVYKGMLDRANFAAPYVNEEARDLDAYVTRKALDGLFVKIEEEERRIRENPAARSSELLQKVFSVLKR